MLVDFSLGDGTTSRFLSISFASDLPSSEAFSISSDLGLRLDASVDVDSSDSLGVAPGTRSVFGVAEAKSGRAATFRTSQGLG